MRKGRLVQLIFLGVLGGVGLLLQGSVGLASPDLVWKTGTPLPALNRVHESMAICNGYKEARWNQECGVDMLASSCR